MKVLNLKNTDTQNKKKFYNTQLRNRITASFNPVGNDAVFMHVRSDNEPAQSFNDFVEEEIGNSLINSLTFLLIVSTH